MIGSDTLRVRCWSCDRVFNLVITPENRSIGGHYIFKVVPCPYCESSCELTLTEAQASTISSHCSENNTLSVSSLLDNQRVFLTATHR